jgi:ubiquinone/menaquinone biosynthesis C-methylase UbiE
MDARQPRSLLSIALTSGLRLTFRLLYHELSWTYDGVAAAVSVGRWRRWVECVLPYIESGPVLELGHGPGHLQAALARRGQATGGRTAYGLDASPQMGRQAMSRLRRLGLPAHFVTGYAQAAPFSPDSFGTVVATFPTEYIFDPHTAAEIHRLLLPGGLLIVLPSAWLEGRGPLDRLAAALTEATGQAPHWQAPLTEVYTRAGFTVEAVQVLIESSRVQLILGRKLSL